MLGGPAEGGQAEGRSGRGVGRVQTNTSTTQQQHNNTTTQQQHNNTTTTHNNTQYSTIQNNTQQPESEKKRAKFWAVRRGVVQRKVSGARRVRRRCPAQGRTGGVQNQHQQPHQHQHQTPTPTPNTTQHITTPNTTQHTTTQHTIGLAKIGQTPNH